MNTRLTGTILLLMMWCAVPFVALAQDSSRTPRLISVTGDAVVRVVPTQVSLRFGIDTAAKTLAPAKEQHDSHARKILALVREAGIAPEDIQTGSLTMGSSFEEIKERRVLVGYEVKQSMSVLLRDLSKYETVLTRILEAGVNRVDNVDFQSGETRKYADQARVLAIQAAREKAAAYAKELNLKLGRPYSITEEEPNYYGAANALAFARTVDLSAIEPMVAPGELQVRAVVRVQFEIQD